jgi:hypothetical protein
MPPAPRKTGPWHGPVKKVVLKMDQRAPNWSTPGTRLVHIKDQWKAIYLLLSISYLSLID